MSTLLQGSLPADLLVLHSQSGEPASSGTQLGSPRSQLVTPGNGTPMGSYVNKPVRYCKRVMVGERTSSLGSGPGILNDTEVALMESPLPTRSEDCASVQAQTRTSRGLTHIQG